MKDICGHDCQESPKSVTQTEADWVNEQVGEVKVEIAKLTGEPVFGYQDYCMTIDLPNIKMYAQVLLGPEYGELEAHEIAQMLGRVLRSHFVRTRLMPLLGDLGGVTH